MARIGIFFGTETGRTRLVAKQIGRKLAAQWDVETNAPLNIGRATVDQLLACDALIVGTPTLGDGELPGASVGLDQPSWEEFLPGLEGVDLTGKPVAIFGLGDQVKYPDEFVDAIGLLHDALQLRGARMVGRWPVEGYVFNASKAVEDGHFLGLALDQVNQPLLTEARLDQWLAQIRPELLP